MSDNEGRLGEDTLLKSRERRSFNASLQYQASGQDESNGIYPIDLNDMGICGPDQAGYKPNLAYISHPRIIARRIAVCP